jgi:hypothetical protein
MATDLSVNSSYAGKVAGGYIKAALLANDTLQHVTVKENVEWRQVVRKGLYNATFEQPTCGWSPSGEVITSERWLDINKYQVQLEICKNDFLADWETKSEQDGQLHASFQDFLIATILGGIAQTNESVIWTGVDSATSYAGFLTMFTQVGSEVNFVASPVAVTEANVIDKIKLLVAESPLAVRRSNEKPLIYMSSDVAEHFRNAVLGLGAGYYLYQGEGVKMTWNGMYDIVECAGMPANCMVMAQKSNLWFGTNTLNQWNEVQVVDMGQFGEDNVRFNTKFFAGAQYGFGNEIAVYWYD